MNRILSILFIVTLLSPTLLKIGIIGNYWVQFEKYSQELCENKDNVEMSCNGKCQLMKEMKHSEEGVPFSIPNLISFKEFPAVSDPSDNEEYFFFNKEVIVYTNYQPGLTSGMISDVFHPPC